MGVGILGGAGVGGLRGLDRLALSARYAGRVDRHDGRGDDDAVFSGSFVCDYRADGGVGDQSLAAEARRATSWCIWSRWTGRVPVGLPEHAKWAVYREEPLEGKFPRCRRRRKGPWRSEIMIPQWKCLGAMPEAGAEAPETLALRLELAKATGRDDWPANWKRAPQVAE